MDGKAKTGLISIVLATIFLSAYFAGYQNGMENASINIVETPKYAGKLTTEITRADGTVELYEVTNVVTTIGKTRMRDHLGWGNATDPTNQTKYLSLSNDASPQASWTKLANEVTDSGLDRQTGTVAWINSTAFNVTYQWTATASVTVQTGGIHWSPDDDSDGNLWACAAFTSTTLNSGDKIRNTWTVNHT